jgi:hypothetical protein
VVEGEAALVSEEARLQRLADTYAALLAFVGDGGGLVYE